MTKLVSTKQRTDDEWLQLYYRCHAKHPGRPGPAIVVDVAHWLLKRRQLPPGLNGKGSRQYASFLLAHAGVLEGLDEETNKRRLWDFLKEQGAHSKDILLRPAWAKKRADLTVEYYARKARRHEQTHEAWAEKALPKYRPSVPLHQGDWLAVRTVCGGDGHLEDVLGRVLMFSDANATLRTAEFLVSPLPLDLVGIASRRDTRALAALTELGLLHRVESSRPRWVKKFRRFVATAAVYRINIALNRVGPLTRRRPAISTLREATLRTLIADRQSTALPESGPHPASSSGMFLGQEVKSR